mmetsp:Transcript_17290/g.45760  ORF Transcript_17290/g.45760 Transcript_17290/m.45760 type:complete len:396 (-) Transcript_17290:109-1296(-)
MARRFMALTLPMFFFHGRIHISEALLLPSPPTSVEPHLHDKLRQAGFRRQDSAEEPDPHQRRVDERFRQSVRWTTVDVKEGIFSDSVVYRLGNGRLEARPPITLPRAELRVVVSMNMPRVEHYTLLEELSSMSPQVHVVIHCAAWDNTFATTYRDAGWTVVIESPQSSYSQYFRGTENVKYLTHIALFWNQLAPLNAFIVDDAQDGAPPNNEPHMMHPEYRSLSRTLHNMMTASSRPNFMYVLDRRRWWENLSMHPSPPQQVQLDIRCAYDEMSNPRREDDTWEYWLKNTLLRERRGHIPRVISPQSCASFVVSAARLREVMPSGDAFGRILERSQQTSCRDAGARFEVTWPWLFSTCDADRFFTSACAVDRGSCEMLGGPVEFPANASEYIKCD